jgi:hypothetical protein
VHDFLGTKGPADSENEEIGERLGELEQAPEPCRASGKKGSEVDETWRWLEAAGAEVVFVEPVRGQAKGHARACLLQRQGEGRGVIGHGREQIEKKDPEWRQ